METECPFISTSQIILLKRYNLKPQKSQREEEEEGEGEGDREPSHLMFLMSDWTKSMSTCINNFDT